MDIATVPLHLDPVHSSNVCDKRLWIGNLDSRINEYQLLKLVRTYGCIEKLDLLFHKTGPNVGQPRGFAFVTYKTRTEALAAMASLNGQQLGLKKIVVKFAKHANMEEEKSKPELEIAALAGANLNPEQKVSKKTAIQSIEAKLKMMENLNAGDEFVVNKLAAAETSIVAQYQTKQNQTHKPSSNYRRRHHPYNKKR